MTDSHLYPRYVNIPIDQIKLCKNHEHRGDHFQSNGVTLMFAINDLLPNLKVKLLKFLSSILIT